MLSCPGASTQEPMGARVNRLRRTGGQAGGCASKGEPGAVIRPLSSRPPQGAVLDGSGSPRPDGPQWLPEACARECAGLSWKIAIVRMTATQRDDPLLTRRQDDCGQLNDPVAAHGGQGRTEQSPERSGTGCDAYLHELRVTWLAAAMCRFWAGPPYRRRRPYARRRLSRLPTCRAACRGSRSRRL